MNNRYDNGSIISIIHYNNIFIKFINNIIQWSIAHVYPRADNSEILENIIALPISFNQRYTTTVCHFGGPESSGYAIATGDMTQDTETAHPILQSVNNISYDSLLACLIILGY